MTIRVFEAFSGVGSQRMALRNLGIDHEVVAIAEIDKFAIKSYEAIHGETNNLGDISQLSMEDIPDHDLFTYSFPCQDISVAGKGLGLDEGSDTRSGLLWECQKVIAGKKPKYLLLENVKNLVGKKHKHNFDRWLDWLEEQGYTNYWQVLNAKNYGIPQNRERVFVVSILGDHTPYKFPEPIELELRLKDVLEEVVDEKFYLTEVQTERLIQNSDYLQDLVNEPRINVLAHRKNYRRNTQVFDPNGITETLDTGQGGGRGHYTIGVKMNRNEVKDEQDVARALLARDYKGFGNQDMNGVVIAASRGRNPENPSDRTVGNPTEQRLEINKQGTSNTITTVQKDNYVVYNNYRIRKLTPKECWRLMGFSDDDFHKAEKANSNSQLYKQAGNSIVVDVLEGIFKQLLGGKNMNQLIKKTEQWFVDRNLHSLNGAGQLTKLNEEVGELEDAFVSDDRSEEIDAVGDILVVLIGYCMQRDLDIMDCLNSAYWEIKDRKGKVVDGVFVKEVKE